MSTSCSARCPPVREERMGCWQSRWDVTSSLCRRRVRCPAPSTRTQLNNSPPDAQRDCGMNRTYISFTLLLVALVAIEMNAQTSPSPHPATNSATNVPAERTVALSVPTGTPLQIALDVGFAVRSHTLGILMSAYGGSRSIYMIFLDVAATSPSPRTRR
jgi:hypothetical protein